MTLTRLLVKEEESTNGKIVGEEDGKEEGEPEVSSALHQFSKKRLSIIKTEKPVHIFLKKT